MIEGKKVYLMVVTIFLMLLFTACGSKSRQTEPFVHDDNPIVEQVEPDTVTSAVQKEEPKVEEKPSVPTSSSSSSRSHKSSSYDNMRGFDPASENDMDDNGMSRYMENNDEEGWD